MTAKKVVEKPGLQHVVKAPAKALSPRNCRRYARNAMLDALPVITQAFVNQALLGGCQHFKAALEVAEGAGKAAALETGVEARAVGGARAALEAYAMLRRGDGEAAGEAAKADAEA